MNDLANGWTEELDRLKAENAAQAAEIEQLTRERKRAPVQGFSAGIPWDMHLRAYDVYCKTYGKQQALIEVGCRGGFGTDELDHFIPGWREELSERSKLEARAIAAEAKVAALTTLLEEALLELRHASIFVKSRQKMHPTGTELYDDLVSRIDAALGAKP